MYRWYQLARVCYVFLEDVEAPNSVLSGQQPPSQQNSVHQQLADARWFTRGWTLQELLAPRHIAFYDKSWQCLGTKQTLQPVLARITGVDEAYLAGAELREASVAMRMSWAARRQTTKVEDIAYCLMGIFDVNMPLLYGEGQKAFTRLQEEIFRENDDLSLFAWQPNAAATSAPPHHLNTVPTNDGISVFAKHPHDFLATADLSPSASTGEPTIMSGGKGLKIELPLYTITSNVPHKSALRVAALSCESSRRPSVRPGIVLQELTPGHYMRHPTAGLVQLTESDVAEGDVRQIVIRKTMALAVPRRTQGYAVSSREVAVKWY